jgi:Protein of unknown function (DUF1569)
MPVNTAKVDGRRKVKYQSYEELLADADRLSTGKVKQIGNWTPGMVFQHLATAYNGSIDGLPGTFPWYLRLVVRLLKKRLLAGPMPAGFQPPRDLADVVMPAPTPTEEGLANLRAAVARLGRESSRSPHPLFGKLTNKEWDRVHLGHASLHMSFLAPADA